MKRLLQGAAVTLFLGMVLMSFSCSSSRDSNPSFKEVPFKIADYGLFDLGIMDINEDDMLDVFTVNHSGRQSILVNKGGLEFEDVYSALKMEQDHAFPGLVVTEEQPNLTLPGLYVYWNGPDVVVRGFGIQPEQPVSGRIEILSPVKITHKKNFDVTVAAEKLASGATNSILAFNGKGEGHFNFEPYIHALPIEFHIEAAGSGGEVFVGHDRVAPGAMDFTINMRDRHGMAWTDFNDDGCLDVFITRGGLRGTMKSIPMDFWDELLIYTPTGMTDKGRTLGLAKDGCAGRQAAWVDYNADNKLDIYVSCDREIGLDKFPNKLFQQTPEGSFIDSAGLSGLAIPTAGTFLWVDADLDNDLDLFWSDSDGFALYRNTAGNFTAVAVKVPFPHGRSFNLSLADYDRDGDLDIFSAASKGNALFVNTDGMYTAVDPKSVGLPQNSRTVNWVDYDNDGLVDLHAVPEGLYQQLPNGKFVNTGMLETPTGSWPLEILNGSRVAWFDADNNGSRDLLISNQYSMNQGKASTVWAKLTNGKKRFGKLGYIWRSQLLLNQNVHNHWLEVQLVGPPTNRQAIGGRVRVTTPDGRQLQQVGGSEGSHYSQGHFRLYFGLGAQATVSQIEVDWPDGRSSMLNDIPGDRLFYVKWEEYQE